MTARADKDLLRAVLEPRKPGALQKIADACAAGADPDGICPAASTSAGPVRAGSTLLTHSVHEGASKAVAKLLECGADPSLADQNGWTPWMASTLVDESRRRRIQQTLSEHGADQGGAHVGELARAIVAGDVEQAELLIESKRDLAVLATFRVDLVGHQVRSGNARMLAFLLERDMQPTSTNLVNAIRGGNLEAVDLLLRHGMAPERTDQRETPLMTAAAMGAMEIVQRLVEAGADVNRSADDDGEWTASFHARQAGHADVADWLDARMSDAALARRENLDAARDPRFKQLYEQATASEDLTTDEIVAIVAGWDEDYGVSVSAAAPASLALEFSSVPSDLDTFFAEVIAVCPDAADSADEASEELAANRKLFLWWD